jgi:sterol desaturase/sphingolipid hydroxylase (fatty acid hydroxylase superfamily)
MSDITLGAPPQPSKRKRERAPEFHPGKISSPPVFVRPWSASAFAKFVFSFPGYLWPWNALYLAIALATWTWATPSFASMRAFSLWWVGAILVCNYALTLAVYGAWHFRLYVQRAQNVEFKYNGRWLTEDSDFFLFRGQLRDNMFWSLASAVPIWTAWEVVSLWLQANAYVPTISFAAHPIGFVALMLFIPLFAEAHFYAVHRLIHWPPLYRTVHKLHHRNVNPGPWSGLSMHPVEHLLYFFGVMLHWIVPSHPLHVIFHLQHRAFAPAVGHNGFDRVKLPSGSYIGAEHFDHYLHHKYFEVNYASGLVPFDRIFGTFHDGTAQATEAMNRRSLRTSAGFERSR